MNTISTRRVGAIALLGVVCAAGPVAATIQVLPGGASALQEAHGDWRVACELQNGQKACTLSQQIMDKDSRQRILAIELSAGTPNAADGTLALPFGLALDKGITLQVDESAAGPALSFRTCLPAGCIVTVAFDAKKIAALRAGTTLTVKATGDNAQEVSFGISLNGFASALDRTAALTK
jgi:invasion protein IalB